MIYLSQILGKPVRDSVGQPLGKIADLAITIEEPFGGDFPPVTLVLVRAGGVLLRLRWELIADLNEGGKGSAALLDTPRAHLTVGAEKGGEIFLKRDVLDKQIIDMSSNRLVRVNDVFLVQDEKDNTIRAAGVDVSFRGLLRRVGGEDIFMRAARRAGVSVSRRHIPWNEVEVLSTESGGRIQLKVPVEKLSRKHPTDLAAIVHQMNPAERTELFEQLDTETAAETLEEMDDEIAADILEEMEPEDAADIIEEMDPDEAADVLGEVESDEATEAILQHIEDPEEAADIKHLLSYDEGTAGALMTTDVACVQREMTVAQALDKLRSDPPEPSALHYIHVEDIDEKLVGVISLAEAVLASPDTSFDQLLEALDRDEPISVDPETDAYECARLIAKYDLLSLPVVDLHGALLGMVTVDDVLDVLAPDEWKSKSSGAQAQNVADDSD
jgi:CBS domain-containing protein/sporulation protein YlmC with PRC-barrel domain